MAEDASLRDFFGPAREEDDERESENGVSGTDGDHETDGIVAETGTVEAVDAGAIEEHDEFEASSEDGGTEVTPEDERTDASGGTDANDGRDGVGDEAPTTGETGASMSTPLETEVDGTDAGALRTRTYTTYAWSPAGVACRACGATTERRWRDSEQLVCANCKEW